MYFEINWELSLNGFVNWVCSENQGELQFATKRSSIRHPAKLHAVNAPASAADAVRAAEYP
jgi:hypothetical protein